MARTSKTIVADIAGGTEPLKRDIGTNLTIEHCWSVYRWYPGYRDLINLEVDAIFSNGVNEDEIIDISRLMECKDAARWAINVGWSCPVVDARDTENPKIENWHPYVDGVGANFTSFSAKGHPLEITVYLNTNQTGGNQVHYEIPHYPCEVDEDGEYMDDKPLPGGYGFFHIRTQGNIKGVQGLPKYMHLIDAFEIQWDIIKAYAPYAEKQGMAFPTVFLEDNSSTNRSNIKSQFASQPTTNRLLIMSMEDAVEWISPQAGAYDPFPMLQWLNTIISRASQMNKLMIEGDPAGVLSSSATAISRWETKKKEDQAWWRTQFLGIWKALGATDEVNFKPPTSPTFIDLAEGMKSIVEALMPLVEPEDIVNILNEYLANNDQHIELHALPKEEIIRNHNQEGDDKNNNRKEGNAQNSK